KAIMLEIIRSCCPYPTIREDRHLFDGLLVPQSKKCQHCRTHSCLSLLKDSAAPQQPQHFVCEFGFSVVVIPLAAGLVYVNGIYVPTHNTAMPRDMRKANRSRKVPL